MGEFGSGAVVTGAGRGLGIPLRTRLNTKAVALQRLSSFTAQRRLETRIPVRIVRETAERFRKPYLEQARDLQDVMAIAITAFFSADVAVSKLDC
ncbi:hypothetical protein [Nocardia sp. NPDC004604]|uniref:hypothetical protein n=1 Tax=Nocardia sp. NPDC004604 TaxID=3157013 RepID=UPI0033B09897